MYFLVLKRRQGVGELLQKGKMRLRRQIYGPFQSFPKAYLSWALNSIQGKTGYSSLSSIMCTNLKKPQN